MAKKEQQKYALISVYDKTGIAELSSALINLGYTIISTGGTAKTLTLHRIPTIPIQDVTGNPESFDGRMKTISFQIEAAILYDRSNPSHVKEARELGIKPIDIVICNLYPFEQTSAKPHVTLNEVVESIDVGGPTMIRAAAKNFKNVIVVVSPDDYKELTLLLNSNKVDEQTKKELAAKAFAHLSFYDSQIAKYLSTEQFPQEHTLAGRKLLDVRYGENPHQKGAVYLEPNTTSPLQHLTKIWGRELSLVNITDINAGIESVKLFDSPCAVVIKHNSPCGIALGKTSSQALERAIEADPESAFGGVIVLNSKVDLKTARVIGSFKDEKKANIDIVACPQIENNASSFLQSIRKSMGIYTFGKLMRQNTGLNLKWIYGGYILQTEDGNIEDGFLNWEIATKKKPTKKQLEQMKIAWKFISRIKSNAVIVVDKTIPMTRGIGCGQTSRVRSTQIALQQSASFTHGAILASDSFFPFDDSVKLAAKKGIGAIIQQGGSVNDKASIEKANKAGIPMVFTRRRAFWH